MPAGLTIPARLQGLLALLAGVAAVAAFAPFGWYPLAVLSLAVLFLCWSTDTPRQALLHGALYGLGLFGAGASWVFVSVRVYGHVPIVPSLLIALLFICVLSAFPALAGWLARRWFTGGSALLVLPACWLLLEWLRGWIFTGLPWLDMGASQIDGPLSAWLPLVGEYGVSWLVAVSAAGLLQLAVRRTRLPALLLLLSVWGGGLLLDRVEWTTPAGAALRVSLVQGNIAQDEKWLPENMQSTLAAYSQQTYRLPDSDIVVWPETAIPAFYHMVEEKFLPYLEEYLTESDTALITGIPVLDRDSWDFYNAVLALGGERRFYYKQHLVAFGEYVPLRSVFGLIVDKLVPGNGDFSRGAPDQPLLQVRGYPVGTSICFEAAFAGLIAATVPQAAMLVNVSNDGWFGNSLAPHQHLEIARVRARETGRPMLRATNTGISAIIDHRGAVQARSEQFVRAVVTDAVVPRAGSTPFVRYGHWPVLLLAVLSLLLARVRYS